MDNDNRIQKREQIRDRLFNMVSVGVIDDRLNQGYDIVSTLLLIINLVVSIMMTFEDFYQAHYAVLHWAEAITVAFFAIDYILRLITADKLYPEKPRNMAVVSYVFSGYGIIDLLSFLPYYLPFFFPAGAAVFRLFRVVRIFRLFRINAYSDSLTIIGRVISGKKTQILASVFIIFLLILAASLCMYSVEHEAQPDVFKNAFSGMWWATSTLLTIGYGDIYPITAAGRVLGILITFLGVGLVAIPTGIISAGFVEEYQRAQRYEDVEAERAIHFIEVLIRERDRWIGKKIKDLGLPKDILIATLVRGDETIVPRGNVEIQLNDKLIIAAASVKDDYVINLKEVKLKKNHRWNGVKIRDLDISRQSFIVLVNRNEKMIVPNGNLTLLEGDKVLVYSTDSIRRIEKEALF
ncbi:MAG: ion transporter [Mogibacterium sp.]|nr:ion transporter [Mogibacterium sp.]